MKITDKDEFKQLFYDFRQFAIDVNDFAQNIYFVFRKNNLSSCWLGTIGLIVDRLADIKEFIHNNSPLSLEYGNCIKELQKKYRSYKRRIKKDLNRFKDIVVYTESNDSYLIDEFEYIDSVVKQNIQLLKKWEYLKNKIENLEETKDTIIENLDNISCCNLDRVDIDSGKEDNSMKDCVYNSDCIMKR